LVAWVKQDSNIDFDDQRSLSVIAGVQRNFQPMGIRSRV